MNQTVIFVDCTNLHNTFRELQGVGYIIDGLYNQNPVSYGRSLSLKLIYDKDKPDQNANQDRLRSLFETYRSSISNIGKRGCDINIGLSISYGKDGADIQIIENIISNRATYSECVIISADESLRYTVANTLMNTQHDINPTTVYGIGSPYCIEFNPYHPFEISIYDFPWWQYECCGESFKQVPQIQIHNRTAHSGLIECKNCLRSMLDATGHTDHHDVCPRTPRTIWSIERLH